MLIFTSLLCSAFPTQVLFIFFFSLFSNTTQNQLRKCTEKKKYWARKRKEGQKRKDVSFRPSSYIMLPTTLQKDTLILSLSHSNSSYCVHHGNVEICRTREKEEDKHATASKIDYNKKKELAFRGFMPSLKKEKRRTVCSSICNVWKLSRLLKDFSCRYWQCRRDQRPARR